MTRASSRIADRPRCGRRRRSSKDRATGRRKRSLILVEAADYGLIGIPRKIPAAVVKYASRPAYQAIESPPSAATSFSSCP